MVWRKGKFAENRELFFGVTPLVYCLLRISRTLTFSAYHDPREISQNFPNVKFNPYEISLNLSSAKINSREKKEYYLRNTEMDSKKLATMIFLIFHECLLSKNDTVLM